VIGIFFHFLGAYVFPKANSVEKEYEKLKELGVNFTMPPTKVTGSTIAALNDTCGNLIQIVQLD